MTKSTFEKELEKAEQDIEEFGNELIDRAGDFESLNQDDSESITAYSKGRRYEALQSALKELEKKRFSIPEDSEDIEDHYVDVVKWLDIEEAFGGNNGK